MNLSIITVTWNNATTIIEQLKTTALAGMGLEFEQIVVDNDSKDKTVEILKYAQSEYKNLKIIENSKNLGFAKANNLGVQESMGDYILFLNPDMKLEKGSIKELLDYLKNNSEVGMIGPKLVREDGQISRGDGPRRFPKFIEVVIIFFKLPKLFPQILNKYYYTDLDKDSVQVVDSIRGSFMLIDKKIIKDLENRRCNSQTGVWDERYFCWFEDIDLCREINKLGKKIIYYPRVKAVDMVGVSFKQRSVFWKQYIFFVSAFKYFKKWGMN